MASPGLPFKRLSEALAKRRLILSGCGSVVFGESLDVRKNVSKSLSALGQILRATKQLERCNRRR